MIIQFALILPPLHHTVLRKRGILLGWEKYTYLSNYFFIKSWIFTLWYSILIGMNSQYFYHKWKTNILFNIQISPLRMLKKWKHAQWLLNTRTTYIVSWFALIYWIFHNRIYWYINITSNSLYLTHIIPHSKTYLNYKDRQLKTKQLKNFKNNMIISFTLILATF